MLYGYKEKRHLTRYDLRSVCIEYNFYHDGDVEEYERMLSKVDCDNITTDIIVEIVDDIIEHSVDRVDKMMKEYGMTINEFFITLMEVICNRCTTTFEEI